MTTWITSDSPFFPAAPGGPGSKKGYRWKEGKKRGRQRELDKTEGRQVKAAAKTKTPKRAAFGSLFTPSPQKRNLE
jgi:hypothetical protein